MAATAGFRTFGHMTSPHPHQAPDQTQLWLEGVSRSLGPSVGWPYPSWSAAFSAYLDQPDRSRPARVLSRRTARRSSATR